MDPVTKIEVAKSIIHARKTLGETFVIVSHDMDFVAHVCDRAALMRLGKIVDIGETNAVLSKLLEKEREEAFLSNIKCNNPLSNPGCGKKAQCPGHH